MPEPQRRTLDRPPSERYGEASGGEVAPGSAADLGLDARGSKGEAPSGALGASRPEIAAGLTAVATALLLVVLGGALASTSGLLFLAGVGGAFIGLLTAGSTRSQRSRRRLAIGLALAAVVAGAIGIWLVALGQGGTLEIVEFLWATTGILFPIVALVAALAAAWGVRAGPIRD
jgi:hypothetical protein